MGSGDGNVEPQLCCLDMRDSTDMTSVRTSRSPSQPLLGSSRDASLPKALCENLNDGYHMQKELERNSLNTKVMWKMNSLTLMLSSLVSNPEHFQLTKCTFL